MKYLKLGRTSMHVSEVGLGGGPIQRLNYYETEKIIKTALENGINFLDTGRSYKDSEKKIGYAIKGIRDKLIIASKSEKRDKSGFETELHESLRYLGSEYIDLYQMHQLNNEDDLNQVMGKDGALEALIYAKQVGKIRFIGVTSHSVNNAIKAIKTGVFDTVMVPYNFLEIDAEEKLLPLAKELNVGTIAMKPLGGGEFSYPDLSIRYIYNKKNIDVILIGISNANEIIKNIGYLETQEELTKDELGKLKNDEELLGTKFCRRCDYCNLCPKNIHISSILRSDVIARACGWEHQIGKIEKFRKVKDCIECGLCEKRCPYNLPIRKLLKENLNKIELILKNK